MDEQRLGSDLDDFLREEGMLEDVSAVAAKRVVAYQVAQAMARRHLSKSAMARLMGTSRSALDRLLDPDNPSVTLVTLERAATVLGKRLRVELTS